MLVDLTDQRKRDIHRFQLVDKWDKMNIDFRFNPAPCLWYFPLETISQLEEGFESIYQGSVILFHWKIELKTKDAAKFLRGVRTEV